MRTVIRANALPGISRASNGADPAMKTDAANSVSEQLADGVVHVWIVPLDASMDTLERAYSCLTADEHARAGQLADTAMRRRFTMGRAALRRVLGLCVGRDASALTLLRSEQGKPRLDGGDDPEFSLSHSRDVAVVAVAAAPVGIDLEHPRTPRHLERVARRILHRDTVGHIMALHGEARVAAFLDAWTLREAHVKAVGGGLFQTPDALPFDAALPCDGVLRRVRDRAGVRTWSVARFTTGSGGRAAIVVNGNASGLRIHEAGETLRLLNGEGT
jgi:4'-phosphopantetheinyl transferase